MPFNGMAFFAGRNWQVRMSIRQDIIARAGSLRHREGSTADDVVLMDAVESHFRSLSDFSSIDGFADFYVLHETEQEICFVGRTYFLDPYGLMPMEVTFQGREDGNISYRVLLGLENQKWKILTEKKRWSSVYLYATEGYAPPWKWDRPLTGLLPN